HLGKVDRQHDANRLHTPSKYVAKRLSRPAAATHLDQLVPPINEPHLANAEGEVRIALEFPVVHPRRPAEHFDGEPVLGDLSPLEIRSESPSDRRECPAAT